MSIHVYPSVDGLVDYLHFLTTRTEAALDICVPVCVCACNVVVGLEYVLRSGAAGSHGNSSILMSCQSVFQSGHSA